MKLFNNSVLVILLFLSLSSGIPKVLLMEQEVNFFGPYGFSPAILIAYGISQ